MSSQQPNSPQIPLSESRKLLTCCQKRFYLKYPGYLFCPKTSKTNYNQFHRELLLEITLCTAVQCTNLGELSQVGSFNHSNYSRFRFRLQVCVYVRAEVWICEVVKCCVVCLTSVSDQPSVCPDQPQETKHRQSHGGFKTFSIIKFFKIIMPFNPLFNAIH